MSYLSFFKMLKLTAFKVHDFENCHWKPKQRVPSRLLLWHAGSQWKSSSAFSPGRALTSLPLAQFSPTIILAISVVMPKSRNLPMTTREPISNAKAREFSLPSSSWGSHRYRHSSYREEPQVLDYIAYIGSIHGKKGFLGRRTSDWSLSFKGLCVGSWLVPIV